MIEIDATEGAPRGRLKRLLQRTGTLQRLAVLSAVLLIPAAADAKTIYVNAAKAGGGNGASWGTAFKYLQDALRASRPGDQVFLAKGTYYPDDFYFANGQNIYFGDRELSFVLNKVNLYGGFAGNETQLSQRNPLGNPTILSGEIWEVTPQTPGYER